MIPTSTWHNRIFLLLLFLCFIPLEQVAQIPNNPSIKKTTIVKNADCMGYGAIVEIELDSLPMPWSTIVLRAPHTYSNPVNNWRFTGTHLGNLKYRFTNVDVHPLFANSIEVEAYDGLYYVQFATMSIPIDLAKVPFGFQMSSLGCCDTVEFKAGTQKLSGYHIGPAVGTVPFNCCVGYSWRGYHGGSPPSGKPDQVCSTQTVGLYDSLGCPVFSGISISASPYFLTICLIPGP
ncbi:hypothetical protein KFE98_20250 [bacterium SCSIO 12741]|nr:hypothetical protein KFE98_20250 [bacterium SCSIO 12741]